MKHTQNEQLQQTIWNISVYKMHSTAYSGRKWGILTKEYTAQLYPANSNLQWNRQANWRVL